MNMKAFLFANFIIFLLVNSLFGINANKYRFSSYWVRPATSSSNDTLRAAFQNKTLTMEEIIDHLCIAYPDLQLLFSASPQLHDVSTIKKRAIERGNSWKHHSALPTLPFCSSIRLETLIQWLIALHEIGVPVTASDEEPLSTEAIVCAVFNRIGLQSEEITLARALIRITSLQQQNQHAISEHLQHFALQLQIPVTDLYSLCAVFWEIRGITDYPPLHISTSKIVHHIPLTLHNSYILEKIDPKHRSGKHLQKARDRYERMVIQNPYNKWKGKFWKWLDRCDRGKKIPTGHFYTQEELQEHRARFKDGKLLIPPDELPDEMNIKMFVIGLDETLYIATKRTETPAINHGSFFGCEPVLSAGKFIISQDGSILKITNHSGHYRPGIIETIYCLEFLEEQGVDLEPIALDVKLSENNFFSSAKQWLVSQQG